MIRNFFISAIRSLLKIQAFSFINIFGLAVGMAACIFIFQYVYFHLKFDDFHKHKENIYRLNTHFIQNGKNSGPKAQASPALLPDAFKSSHSYVRSFARLWSISYMNHSLIYKGSNGILSYDEPQVFLTDEELFNIFDLPIINGSLDRFNDPYTMVLSESNAQKYFSNEDPIGKKMTLSGNIGMQEYEIVAIMKDLPSNTHLDLNLLLSFSSYEKYNYGRSLDWNIDGIMTYFLMEDEVNIQHAVEDLKSIYLEHNAENKDKPSFIVDFGLEPLMEIHMGNVNAEDFKPGVDKTIVFSMALIALIILAIAWINYLNLSLVKSLERIREIGVRTVMGSNRRQITLLFVIEALIVNITALIIAVTITQIGGPYVRDMVQFDFQFTTNWELVAGLSAMIAIGSVISSFYPSIILKTFKTADILLGKRTDKVSGVGVRKFLVAIQFVISFILVAGTLTVHKQIGYMKSADLGIDISDIMVIKSPPSNVLKNDSASNLAFNTFRASMEQYPFIKKFTNSGDVPGKPINWGSNRIKLRSKPKDETLTANFVSMGLGFHEFFNIELIAGRLLQKGDDPWSRGDVVINRKLSEMLGFDDPNEAIGARLDGFYNNEGIIIRGVVENHHHTSLHSDFDPIIYILSSWTEFYFIKFDNNNLLADTQKSEQIRSAIGYIEEEWNKSYPYNGIDYFFLDQSYNTQYIDDERFGKVFSSFSLLAIFIACLGLFGLFSFALQQRVKEIGIRKVLGANPMNLITLLTRNYLLIIIISYIISVPLFWILASEWLENYSFKIDLGFDLVLYPFLIVLTITILTMLLRLFRSLRSNPVDSLRYE